MARNVWLIEVDIFTRSPRYQVPETYLRESGWKAPRHIYKESEVSSPRDIFTGLSSLTHWAWDTRISTRSHAHTPHLVFPAAAKISLWTQFKTWGPCIYERRGERPLTYVIKIWGLNSRYNGSKTGKCILIWLGAEARCRAVCGAWVHRDCIGCHGTLVATGLTCMTFVWLTAAC